MEHIIIGRDREDLREYQDKGTVFVGRHLVGEGDEAHLTNAVQMDVARPHIVLLCGKRGTGKSYSGGIIAEEITRLPPLIRQNLSVLIIDTMGIYWSMKRPNERSRQLLEKWGLKPMAVNARVFIPQGFMETYAKSSLDFDAPFTLPCGELTSEDWNLTFGFSSIDEYGIAVDRAIKSTRQQHGSIYDIDDIMATAENDKRTEQKTRDAVVNRFLAAKEWGIFEKAGTPLMKFFEPGKITVLDVSHYASFSAGWSVRGLLVGLLSRKIYQERLIARKSEEMEIITGEKKKTIPMVWIMIDEAHQFLPQDGSTPASEPLLTLVRQGREPGISLLFMTQRPNKLHEDALAQSDLIIAHRLTAKADIEALRSIMQSYVLDDIQELINALPRQKGSAIVLDDNSERLYAMQVRPRFSWHAGGSPSAIKKKGLFE